MDDGLSDPDPRCCFSCRAAVTKGMGVIEALEVPMVFAPCACGNKRCPRSNHHGNVCSGSNATGQPGSAWEHVAGPGPI